MDTLSLDEAKNDIMKTLDIPSHASLVVEAMSSGEKLCVTFRFNMRSAVSNPAVFERGGEITRKYNAASISVLPRESRHDGLSVELRVVMYVKQVKA